MKSMKKCYTIATAFALGACTSSSTPASSDNGSSETSVEMLDVSVTEDYGMNNRLKVCEEKTLVCEEPQPLCAE